jgi:hypothetical protein
MFAACGKYQKNIKSCWLLVNRAPNGVLIETSLVLDIRGFDRCNFNAIGVVSGTADDEHCCARCGPPKVEINNKKR